MEAALSLMEMQLPEGVFWADVRPRERFTAGSHVKAVWRCARGHSWKAQVYSIVLEKCGCPYCAGRLPIPGETDLATLEPELAEQFDREKNGSLRPEDLLPSSHVKVWWRCGLGHSWEAPPYSRSKGSGCPYCTGKKVLADFNDLATLNPPVAAEWHPTLNKELTPRGVSPGSNQKVWWQCREGHVWRTAIYSRTRRRGSGCPVCAGTVRKRTIVSERTIRGSSLPLAASADIPRVN